MWMLVMHYHMSMLARYLLCYYFRLHLSLCLLLHSLSLFHNLSYLLSLSIHILYYLPTWNLLHLHLLMLNLMLLLHSLLRYMFMWSYMSLLSDMLLHSLLMLLLVIRYRFIPLILLLLSYYSHYPLSLFYMYHFLSFHYLVYMLSHLHLYYMFTYLLLLSLSHSMLNFHNFIPLHYSMSSNFMSLLSFIHYYLMWNYLPLVLHHLLSMLLYDSLCFLNYPLHMLYMFHFMAVLLSY